MKRSKIDVAIIRNLGQEDYVQSGNEFLLNKFNIIMTEQSKKMNNILFGSFILMFSVVTILLLFFTPNYMLVLNIILIIMVLLCIIITTIQFIHRTKKLKYYGIYLYQYIAVELIVFSMMLLALYMVIMSKYIGIGAYLITLLWMLVLAIVIIFTKKSFLKIKKNSTQSKVVALGGSAGLIGASLAINGGDIGTVIIMTLMLFPIFALEIYGTWVYINNMIIIKDYLDKIDIERFCNDYEQAVIKKENNI
ncbi:TPA: hypothetical protein ACGY2Z_002935 [Listeria monocytogenes]